MIANKVKIYKVRIRKIFDGEYMMNQELLKKVISDLCEDLEKYDRLFSPKERLYEDMCQIAIIKNAMQGKNDVETSTGNIKKYSEDIKRALRPYEKKILMKRLRMH